VAFDLAFRLFVVSEFNATENKLCGFYGLLKNGADCSKNKGY
jgi:hypothetical protein